MPSQITLKDAGALDRDVKLHVDEHCHLWVDQARVHGIAREGSQVGLRVAGLGERVWIDADAYLDFVGLHPIRIE